MRRASGLDCACPLALSVNIGRRESPGRLAQSRTMRRLARCTARFGVFHQAARPAKSRHYLVSDKKSAMAAGDLYRLVEPTNGLWNHSGSTLDKRLEHEGGIRICFFCFESFRQSIQALPVTFPIKARVCALRFGPIVRTAVAVGGHDFVALKEQASIGLVKRVQMTQRHCANCVAMIGAFKRKEARFFGELGAAQKLVGKLEGHFERGRAVIRKEDLC